MSEIKNILIVHNGALGDFLCAWPGIYAIREHFCKTDGSNRNFWFHGREFAWPWVRDLGLGKAPSAVGVAVEEMYVSETPPAWLESTLVFWFCLKRPVSRLIHPNLISIPVLDFPTACSETGGPPLVIAAIRARLEGAGIFWQENWRQCWQKRFGIWNGADSRQIALIPGTGHSAKSWSLENFEILSKKLDECGFDPVYLLGPVEQERGVLPLRARAEYPVPASELAARMMRMRAVVACDGGPAHLASHHGVPGVVLFGPVNWQSWAPQGLVVVAPPVELPAGYTPGVDDPKEIDRNSPRSIDLIEPDAVLQALLDEIAS